MKNFTHKIDAGRARMYVFIMILMMGVNSGRACSLTIGRLVVSELVISFVDVTICYSFSFQTKLSAGCFSI